MGKLIYSVITSLDGYIEDETGKFDWAVPDEEVHTFINNLLRNIGTHLYGRRLYEVMAVWETMDTLPDLPQFILDFAHIWQPAEKIVYSKTLKTVTTERTQLEQEFNPEAIRKMKAEARQDILIGGPSIAASAIQAGLIDEYHFFVSPIIVGNGKRAMPKNIKLNLELMEVRRFDIGMAYLRYRGV